MKRLRYYRRVARSYLGRGQSQLSFWWERPAMHEDAPTDRLGAYYMTFSDKARYQGPFDPSGVPLLDYHGAIGPHLNPIAIAQYGLAKWNEHERTGDPAARRASLAQAEWLRDHLEPNAKGVPVWMHHFDWEYAEVLKAPWYSGLAQGQGLSLLARAHAAEPRAGFDAAADEERGPDPSTPCVPLRRARIPARRYKADDRAPRPLTRVTYARAREGNLHTMPRRLGRLAAPAAASRFERPMKQVIENPRTGEIRVEEVPAPIARAGGVLVRTAASVMSSGTESAAIAFGRKNLVQKAAARPDLVKRVVRKARADGVLAAFEAAKSRLESPLPLGYSSAGHVLTTEDADLAPGTLVACAGAGFACHAEVAWVPEQLTARVPAGVTPESAAFATLGAVALHGVHRAGVGPGHRVGVVGLGLVGNLTAQILAAYSCVTLGVDVHPAALAAAANAGLSGVAKPEDAPAEAERLSNGAGLDCVLVTAASTDDKLLDEAAALCREGGTICVVGDVPLSASRRAFYERELNLVVSRSYGFGRHDPVYELAGVDYPIAHARWTIRRNLEEVLRLMSIGRLSVDPLVRRRFPVGEAPAAYEALMKGAAAGGAIVLTYDGNPAAASRTVAVGPPPRAAEGVGVAMIGTGSFARSVLLPALRAAEGWAPRTLVSATGVTARDAAARFGFPSASTDADAVAADPTVGAVVVATRHDLHARLAAKMLLAGKDVLVEKPLALTPEELQEVAEAAVKSGRRLQVGFNRRFAPLTREMRAFLAGATGPTAVHIRVRADSIPADHWLRDPVQGGGRVLGEACHFVDLAQHLVASPPVAVSAVGAGAGVDAEDHFQAILRFADGSTASLAYVQAGPEDLPKERVDALRGGRAATLDNFRSLTLLDGNRKRTLGGRRQDKGHRDEVAAFLGAIRAGEPSPTSLDSVVATTNATFALRDALATGTTVRVPRAAGVAGGATSERAP